jgi:lipoic acid synthetase
MSSDAPAPRAIPIVTLPSGLEPASPGLASLEPGARQVAGDKIARSPVQFADAPVLRKPRSIRGPLPLATAVQQLKSKLRENRLVTVCEEDSCPNINESFSHCTATFKILG